MKSIICAIASILTLYCQTIVGESITGSDITYREMCLKAATDPWFFQNFRSLSDYAHALEVGNGSSFANYLLKNASEETLKSLKSFQHLEDYGNPPVEYYPGIGSFSGTTLRYVVIADQIKRLFQLSNDSQIVEIGAGFGGQCYILSLLQSFSQYTIYDLPEAEALIEKMLGVLAVPNFTCAPLEAELPVDKIDLVISNYAFSECNRETQLSYFERVIKKAERGYITYNQITGRVYGLDYLSPVEFITLLNKNGKKVQIYNEPIATDVDNLLIVWDK